MRAASERTQVRTADSKQAHRPEERSDLNRRVRDLLETDPELAGTMVQELLEQVPEADLYNRARALRTLGVAQVKRGDYTAAQKTLRQALNLSHAAHDPATLADIYTHLSSSAYFLNNFEAALAHAIKGLEASREAGSKLDEAFALHNIGWVYDNFGLHQDALDSFSAELNILEEHGVGGSRKARVLNAVGMGYRRLADHARATTYLESSLAFAKQLGDLRSQALALGNLGVVKEDLEQPEAALSYYEESITLYLRTDDPYELARQYTHMGKTLLGLARDGEARSAFTQALVHLQRAPNVSLKIDVLLNLSELAKRQGEAHVELERLNNALELADPETAPADAYRVHRALAELYKARKKPQKALAHFETFHGLQERVRREAELRKTKGLLLQFDVERLEFEREMYRLKHVELARAYAQLEEVSVRDPLTNLHNRRFLAQQLAQEVERAKRYGRPLSLMLCDIDNFKQVNDTFSHAVGDEVLKAVADLLKSRTRTSDIKARFGGEELVAVFPETSLQDAVSLCEAMRRAAASYDWAGLHPDLRVTLSVGVAQLQPDDTPDSLLRSADDRMYEAKGAGKNRVRC